MGKRTVGMDQMKKDVVSFCRSVCKVDMLSGKLDLFVSVKDFNIFLDLCIQSF